MPDILYTMVQTGTVVGFAIVAGWLVIKNVQRQMESEDTSRGDK